MMTEADRLSLFPSSPLVPKGRGDYALSCDGARFHPGFVQFDLLSYVIVEDCFSF